MIESLEPQQQTEEVASKTVIVIESLEPKQQAEESTISLLHYLLSLCYA